MTLLDLMPHAIHKGDPDTRRDDDVTSPPAASIIDRENNCWILGLNLAPRAKCPNGQYAYGVLRNGRYMGEDASVIEMRGGRIRIYTYEGYKRFNGHTFV
jgi:hypothetical protein